MFFAKVKPILPWRNHSPTVLPPPTHIQSPSHHPAEASPRHPLTPHCRARGSPCSSRLLLDLIWFLPSYCPDLSLKALLCPCLICWATFSSLPSSSHPQMGITSPFSSPFKVLTSSISASHSVFLSYHSRNSGSTLPNVSTFTWSSNKAPENKHSISVPCPSISLLTSLLLLTKAPTASSSFISLCAAQHIVTQELHIHRLIFSVRTPRTEHTRPCLPRVRTPPTSKALSHTQGTESRMRWGGGSEWQSKRKKQNSHEGNRQDTPPWGPAEIYIYIYIYIHTHTHTHTHSLWQLL